MRALKPPSRTVYAGGVIAMGGVVIGIAFANLGHAPWTGDYRYWLLTLFVLLAELSSIQIQRQSLITEEITTSTSFSFAILLLFGPAATMLALAVASAAGDLGHRKNFSRTLFNIGQYAISVGAASIVLSSLSIHPVGLTHRLQYQSLGGVALAALVFYVLNTTLTNVAVALTARGPVMPFIRGDLVFQGLIDAVLLGISPLIVLIAQQQVWMLPLLLLPIAAVGRSARTSVKNADLAASLGVEASQRKHEALHDSLTGLANRRLLNDELSGAFSKRIDDGKTAAVLVMDLDRFKQINDTLGHSNGDRVLKEVAMRLSRVASEEDTVARLGGDEFAILLRDVTDTRPAEETAQKILEVLGLPMPLHGLTLDLGASMGIALFPQHGATPDDLMQKADVAMYSAKELRTGFEVYSPNQHQFKREQLDLLSQVRGAIERREFILYFQPKARLSDGTIEGVETLLRWQHPLRGLLLPAEFIPLVENTGLIRPLTLFVLEESLKQLQKWNRDGLDLSIAVNVSAHSLLDPSFATQVSDIAASAGVELCKLELELTESSVMVDPVKSLETMNLLSEMGVRFSIDDFGTGYSSLAYLQKLPVAALKVDKSFVLNMQSSEANTMIVQSTIELGRNLGLLVVAEGVEDSGVWKELDRMNCDYAQGFLLSRPVEADVLTEMLHARRGPRVPSQPPAKLALARWHRSREASEKSVGLPA
jgi:diguanylate cyclase (GGDEF)-like protein